MLDQPRVNKATGLRLFWATMWARAYPRMVGAFRERSWMFFETFLPVLAVAATSSSTAPSRRRRNTSASPCWAAR